MELLHRSFMATTMASGNFNFLLKPLFSRELSASIHLFLLFILFISWVLNKFKINGNETQKQSLGSIRVFYYKPTLFSCLGFSLFNIVLCLLVNFYWYRNGWTDEKIVTLLDFVLRVLGWLALSLYLHTHFSGEPESKYPTVVRVWWGFFFAISCYTLVIDYLYYKQHQILPIQFLVSDFVAVVVSLFFCYVGFFFKNKGETEDSQNTYLEEPLIGRESNKSKKGCDTDSPFANGSVFSILTFSWMSRLVAIGFKKPLDLEDVPQLAKVDSVENAFPIFKNKVDSDRVSTLNLVKGLVLTTWKEIVLTGFVACIHTLASYVGPYLIDTFVKYLNGNRVFNNEGYALVSAFFIAKLVECLAQRHWWFRLQQAGLRARAALVAMIYHKGLNLSCQSKQGHTSGEIINFMAVDAERIGDFVWYMHEPWLVILQVGLALTILYTNLGVASVAALFATVIVMLANVPLGSLQEKFQDKLMTCKDKRMKATSEVLRSMRILKLQGWEMKFLSKIYDLRNNEAGWLRKYMYSGAMASFVFWGAPSFVSVVTFGTCMLVGIPLESGKVLSALATFRILQEPIYNLPDTISMIAQTKVSLDRISSFLRLEDLQSDVRPWAIGS